MPAGPGPVLSSVLRAPRVLYRWRLGRLPGRRFLLLEHVGRSTGTRYRTVLEVVCYERSTGPTVVMSGRGRNSNWFHNVEVAGNARVSLGSGTMTTHAQILDDGEAPRMPAAYENRNRRIRPVVRRVRSRLAGFRYDGTDDSRLRLVRELPLVRFVGVRACEEP